jgi:hypothetical protein
MADKTWTAVGLRQGKMTIMPPQDGETSIQRRYEFEDAGGEVLTDIKGGRLVKRVVLADLPAPVRDALVVIDDWTMQQSLEQEGMADA